MKSTPASDALTDDAFLGGRLRLWQPLRGYRAGIDPVLLAAAVPAKVGQSVMELGCGAGAAMLCLATRVPGLGLTGIELQADYADLARHNAERNGIVASVHCADLRHLPAEVRAQRFDHILANPPYHDRATGTEAADAGRDTALAGDTPLVAWMVTAAKRLAPRGTLTVIQKADRLPDLMAALGQGADLGRITLRPVAPRAGRAATLVIVQAVKGARTPFALLPPLILHTGERHLTDGDDYSDWASAVLRHAAPLPCA